MERQLRKLQLTELEILKVIDEICRKHHISYSLYAGTLLGAVRHQGFIPWDDDLDICMGRDEYNRFLEVWEQEQPKGYLLQNKENSPDFTCSFTKIRKENTIFQATFEANFQYHMGIFVDVFPLDRCPVGALKEMLFRLDCVLYQLYTREYVPPTGSCVVKYISRMLLAVVPPKSRMAVRRKMLKRITRYSNDRNLPTIAIETMRTLGTLYPADMLDRYVYLPFESCDFMCFADWDEHLRRKFGDYMQLPPEEERTWKHPPLKIDFEKYDIVSES